MLPSLHRLSLNADGIDGDRTTPIPTSVMDTYKVPLAAHRAEGSSKKPKLDPDSAPRPRNDACIISQEEFEDGDDVWRSPSGYLYNPFQVFRWFQDHDWKDPMTRQAIDPSQERGEDGLLTYIQNHWDVINILSANDQNKKIDEAIAKELGCPPKDFTPEVAREYLEKQFEIGTRVLKYHQPFNERRPAGWKPNWDHVARWEDDHIEVARLAPVFEALKNLVSKCTPDEFNEIVNVTKPGGLFFFLPAWTPVNTLRTEKARQLSLMYLEQMTRSMTMELDLLNHHKTFLSSEKASRVDRRLAQDPVAVFRTVAKILFEGDDASRGTFNDIANRHDFPSEFLYA